jgi:hypothetical protein
VDACAQRGPSITKISVEQEKEADEVLTPNETVIVSEVFQAVVIILSQVLHDASFDDRVRCKEAVSALASGLQPVVAFHLRKPLPPLHYHS